MSAKAVEVATAALLLVVGAITAWDSYRLGASWESDGPQAGYFPFYIGLIIAGSSAVTLFRGLRAPHRKVFVEWTALRRVLSVFVPAVVYVLGVQFFGIYVASVVYIALFMVVLGRYSWLASVSVGAGVMIFFYVAFEIWFKVALYKGVFDPLALVGL